jgi:hypothetical protein
VELAGEENAEHRSALVYVGINSIEKLTGNWQITGSSSWSFHEPPALHRTFG